MREGEETEMYRRCGCAQSERGEKGKADRYRRVQMHKNHA